MAGSDVALVWDALLAGHLNALKTVTPMGFDWRSAVSMGNTALHEVVRMYAMPAAVDHSHFKPLEVAAWLMEQGADPALPAGDQARDVSADTVSHRSHEEIKVSVANRSAMAVALDLIIEMQLDSSEQSDDPGFWEDDIQFLSSLVDIFCSRQAFTQSKRVSLDAGIVDRWEAILHDQGGHDVTIETADGSCGAHSVLLNHASPVLKALLGSAMLEGQHKRIRVSDSPIAAVRLLLDLAFTGGTQTDIEAATALDALELSHRWQIMDVVGMIEKVLKHLLTEATFEQIACAARLMQLQDLRAVCVAYAGASSSITERIAAGTFPRAVLELMGRPAQSTGEAGPKRRRML